MEKGSAMWRVRPLPEGLSERNLLPSRTCYILESEFSNMWTHKYIFKYFNRSQGKLTLTKLMVLMYKTKYHTMIQVTYVAPKRAKMQMSARPPQWFGK